MAFAVPRGLLAPPLLPPPLRQLPALSWPPRAAANTTRDARSAPALVCKAPVLLRCHTRAAARSPPLPELSRLPRVIHSAAAFENRLRALAADRDWLRAKRQNLSVARELFAYAVAPNEKLLVRLGERKALRPPASRQCQGREMISPLLASKDCQSPCHISVPRADACRHCCPSVSHD